MPARRPLQNTKSSCGSIRFWRAADRSCGVTDTVLTHTEMKILELVMGAEESCSLQNSPFRIKLKPEGIKSAADAQLLSNKL